MYLVLVDAYSKSVSAEVMQTITGKNYSETLEHMEFHTKLSETMVLLFKGNNFRHLFKNGIKLIFSAPYHPLFNIGERVMQTVKQGLY